MSLSIKLHQPILPTADKVVGSTADKVIHHIAIDGSITIAELVSELKVPERTLKRIFKQLQEENKIKRIGSNKAGTWEIVKK